MKGTADVRNVVVVSDLHCGCRLGLYPPTLTGLDEGADYRPSKAQRKVWRWWREFWEEFVPDVCHGRRFGVIVNGDTIDGRHHGATTQISHNLSDQKKIALRILEPIREQVADDEFYMVRGTEAHVGPSGEAEEDLARELQAKQDEVGLRSRYELWKRVGKCLCHVLHTIGSTSSSAYESTAVYKELVESYVEAARWSEEPPDIIVRSHRHRYFNTRIATAEGRGEAVVTPGWQLKTPFVYRTGARMSPPQLGGIVIRQGDEEFYTREFVRTIGRPREE